MTARQRQQLKKDFLAHFAKMGNISAAARAIGIDRTCIYTWQEVDPEFLLKFRQAEIESTERLEAEAYRRAHDGVTRMKKSFHQGECVDEYEELEYSDTLLIFLLKARRPDKYRDRPVVVSASDDHISLTAARQVLALAIVDSGDN